VRGPRVQAELPCHAPRRIARRARSGHAGGEPPLTERRPDHGAPERPSHLRGRARQGATSKRKWAKAMRCSRCAEKNDLRPPMLATTDSTIVRECPLQRESTRSWLGAPRRTVRLLSVVHSRPPALTRAVPNSVAAVSESSGSRDDEPTMMVP
jgi:hypothetical protein